MTKPRILHIFTPLRNVSPFDAALALDAGYDAVIPYAWVEASDVPSLVHDAIFARRPEDGVRSAVFIGGKHVNLALDMLDMAKGAMVPPFGLSILVDPSGAFSVGAAMVALTERTLRERFGRDLKGADIAVFGGTGVVAFAAAALAAEQGADVTLVSHDGVERADMSAQLIADRFGVCVKTANGSDDRRKKPILAHAEIVFCAGPAGRRVIEAAHLVEAERLMLAIDSNAAPPMGIEGLDPSANGVRFGAGAAIGVGALAIGDLKYKIQADLFKTMCEAQEPVVLDVRDAFALARKHVGDAMPVIPAKEGG